MNEPIEVEYRAWREGAETLKISAKPKQNVRLHVLLFLLTFLTTTLAWGEGSTALSAVIDGLFYSIPLLTILLFHEFGHYFAARKYGVDVTLPYFIPGIPILIGTFGAVIKMRSPLRSKRALFDIGAAGPLAGVAVAIPIIAVGLAFSHIRPATPENMGDFSLGSSLLFWLLARIITGAPPAHHDLFLHPTAFAGWVGLLVTMLNLLPVGQLDGGHVAYAMLGKQRHQRLGKAILTILLAFGMLPLPQMFFEILRESAPSGWLHELAALALTQSPEKGVLVGMAGYGWLGWLLWNWLLRSVITPVHPPVMDESLPLDRTRKLLGWLTLILFALTFMPAPFITLLTRP